MKLVRFIALVAILHSSLLPVAVQAGPQDEARAYVAHTREVAHEMAHNLFLQQMTSAAISASEKSGALSSFVSRATVVEQAKAELRAYLADTTITLQKRERLTPFALAQYAQKIADDYSEALRRHLSTDLVTLDSLSSATKTFEAVDNFVDQLDGICQVGVGMNVDLPDLPQRQPVMPIIDIRVSASYDGNQVSLHPQPPTGAMPSLPDFPAWSAGVAAVGTGVAASVISGKIIASQAAMAALPASQALAATGIGVGAALVLALAIVVLDTQRAIRESNDIADAQYIIFSEKANALTVMQEYQKICRPVVNGLLEAKMLIRDLRSNSPGAKDRYTAMINEAAPLMKGFEAAQEKLRSRALTTSDLKNTDEYKAYVEYMKKIGEAGFGKITQVSLVGLALSAHKIADWAKESRKDILSIRLGVLGEQIKALNYYAYLQSIESQNAGAIESLNLLMMGNKDLAQLYFQFDKLTAKYVDDLYAVGFARAASQDLKTWATKLVAFEKKFGGGEGLSVLNKKWANFSLAMGLQ